MAEGSTPWATDPFERLGGNYDGEAPRGSVTANPVAPEWLTAETGRRFAEARAETSDSDALTVEATVATETPVLRRDSRGAYLEILPMAALALPHAHSVPLLDSHNDRSVRATIGLARTFRVEGGVLVSTLRLSAAGDVVPVVQRIADGTLTAVSLGYKVAGWRESTDAQGRRTKTATKWTPVEVSIVANPADPNAKLHMKRGKPVEQNETNTPPDDAEMARQSELRMLGRAAGLDAAFTDSLIDQGADVTTAKAAVFDAMQAKRRSAPVIRTHAPQNDDPAVIVRRQSDALAHRMAGGECPDDARPYLGASLRDTALDSLERAGVSTRGLTADEVFTRAAHTTSDFPLVVSNAMGKVALDTYLGAESPLKSLCRQRTLPNFKESTSIRLGNMGRLERLAEDGEITRTSRAENGESMRLETFARGVTVSRKLMIDDDLGLLGDMTSALGEAAAQTEADILVSLITGNPKLSDGKSVFHASRGNVAGAADDPSVEALSAARLAMRGRKGLDGKTLVSATPRFVLVPPDQETVAEQVLASIQPSTAGDVNPFGGRLSLLVEPRLPAGTWYVFADPARLPSMQYAYLASAQGVQIQRMEAWDTLGMKFRAFLDFGAGWLDWRGAHQIAGV